LRKETDDQPKTDLIGPAGEKSLRFAAIKNDRDHAAGCSRVGAVIGSKNLKAFVVRRTDRFPFVQFTAI
jgi:aldehyde:ferredoxin oxidoreductase